MLRLALTLPILLSACLKDETVSGYAAGGVTWRLQEISGEPFAATATLRFPAEGRVEGAGPCNTYRAQLAVPYPWFGLEDIAVTKRACVDLGDEAQFFDALKAMTLAEVSGPVMILSNDAGDEMVFRAESSQD